MATEVLPDDRALRCGRRERVLAQMQANNLDVLVLGRQANVRYVTGARQAWVAGTRPFGPTCVMVGETGEVHMLSTWDEGVPDDIPHENLYGISWNPLNTVANLAKINGAASARRVGTDGLSPAFARLLPNAFPKAELVDGESSMRAARRIKIPEEIAALRESIRVAEVGLDAGMGGLQPGVTEQSLTGVMLEAMAAGGVSTPATQDAVWATSTEHPWRRVARGGRLAPGDLVVFAAGVLANGYIGEVGRTRMVGAQNASARALFERSEALWDKLAAACTPGAQTSNLLGAYVEAGESLPPMPVAHGLGVGFDPPVVSPLMQQMAAGEQLEPGMVLAVTAYVWEKDVGAVLLRKPLLITSDGSEVLTSNHEG